MSKSKWPEYFWWRPSVVILIRVREHSVERIQNLESQLSVRNSECNSLKMVLEDIKLQAEDKVHKYLT